MINSKFNLKINKFNMQKSVTVFLGHRIPLGMLLYLELCICTSRSLANVNMVCKHCTYIQGVSSICASFGQGAACMHACVYTDVYIRCTDVCIRCTGGKKGSFVFISMGTSGQNTSHVISAVLRTFW